MKTREKIIVFLAAAAVLYGAVELFFPAKPPVTGTSGNKKPITDFVQDISVKIASASVPDDLLYKIEMAESPWKRDPFLKKTGKKKRGSTMGEDFVYSGYIIADNHRVAIISGMEYEKGDKIQGLGGKLKEITPLKVVITLPEQEAVELLLEGLE